MKTLLVQRSQLPPGLVRDVVVNCNLWDGMDVVIPPGFALRIAHKADGSAVVEIIRLTPDPNL